MPFAAMWTVMLILLSGCGIGGRAPADTFCAVSRPQLIRPPPREWRDRFGPDERPGDYDRLTAETAAAILAHNEIGAAQCRW